MREKTVHLIISFSTANQAMAMEEHCHAKNMPGRLIPLPREIAAGCGLCWKSAQTQQEGWRKFMETEQLYYEDMKELWM